MRRVLFSVTEQSGSSLLTNLLHGCSFIPGGKETIPLSCTKHGLLVLPSSGKCVIDDVIRKTVSEVPEVYMWNVPAVCGISFYNSLPGDFRFVYLLRDPRNRTESRLSRVLDKNSQLDRKELFENECNWCANELRSVMQIKDDPRFMILFFEDLIADPVGKIDEVYSFCGLGNVKKEVVEKVIRDRVDSSSVDDVGSKALWHSWTKEERDLFRSKVGGELILFGFEKDSSWVDFEPPKPKVEKPKEVFSAPAKKEVPKAPLRKKRESKVDTSSKKRVTRKPVKKSTKKSSK
jgi:hypothetical protein